MQESVTAQQQQTLNSGRQHSSRLDYKPSPFPYTMQRSGLGDVSSIAASDDKCTDNDSNAELSLASNRNSARQPVAVLSETWQEAETQAKAALKLADTLLESRLEDRELAAATQEKWLAGGHCCRVWRCILFRCVVLTPCSAVLVEHSGAAQALATGSCTTRARVEAATARSIGNISGCHGHSGGGCGSCFCSGCRRLYSTHVRVRFQIIRNARITNVGKSQSCMVSK